MKKYEMIKQKWEFHRIIHSNNYVANKFFVLYYEKTIINDYPKFGIAISNKYGNAVERNRAKRITRNIIDKTKNMFKKDENYIIMIRKSFKNSDFQTLNIKFEELIRERNNNEKEN